MLDRNHGRAPVPELATGQRHHQASFEVQDSVGFQHAARDLTLHQQYVTDIVDNARTALATVHPMPFYAKYGDNTWAAVKAYLDTASAQAAAPVINRYSTVLGATDVFITSTVFVILESLRLDLGEGLYLHP
ncbi:hypothetical protein [Kribbella sp. NPDC051620]|uniref:hypothetical protein n=1 Tax=Kribbella sp. NPDC051620 TaxID=3364120 RepID=UPI00379D725C